MQLITGPSIHAVMRRIKSIRPPPLPPPPARRSVAPPRAWTGSYGVSRATPVWLFGGGHVGARVVLAVAPLPFSRLPGATAARALFCRRKSGQCQRLCVMDAPDELVARIPAVPFVPSVNEPQPPAILPSTASGYWAAMICPLWG